MNRTALIYNNISVDWFGIIVAAACLVGVITACMLRKFQKGSIGEILTVFCIGAPLGILIARIQYCVSEIDLEKLGISYIFTGMHDGGYGLYGGMLGVLLAAFASAAIWQTSAGKIADCVAVAGAGVITAGRFATYFTPDELGFDMDPNIFTRPNGDGVHCLAVFIFDGMVEAVIFAFVMILFFRSYHKKGRHYYGKGKIAMVFLMLHGLNQVVMDSMRTDTLSLFGNKFIKAAQIIGIVSWLVIISIFIFQAVKKHTFKARHMLIILTFAVLIVISISKEYRVGNSNYISAHIVMGICMIIMAVLSMKLFSLSEVKVRHSAVTSTSETSSKTGSGRLKVEDTSDFDFGRAAEQSLFKSGEVDVDELSEKLNDAMFKRNSNDSN